MKQNCRASTQAQTGRTVDGEFCATLFAGEHGCAGRDGFLIFNDQNVITTQLPDIAALMVKHHRKTRRLK